MFRKVYNQALFTARLVPDGPVLIKEGGVSLDPAAPQMAFVRTRREGGTTVYLPGSSIKGVLRAHAERLLATALGPPAAEDPFDWNMPRRQRAAQHLANEQDSPRDVAAGYRASCEADRLFGSTLMAGRFRIADAFPVDAEASQRANRTEMRWEVAIERERQTGQNPRDVEVVTDGVFAFKATLENFDLWMLFLVLQTLQDLHDGHLQLGHGKSRGRGAVRLEKAQLALRWPRARPERILGAGACEPSGEVRQAYGLDGEDAVDLAPGAEPLSQGLFEGHRFTGWGGVMATLQPRWNRLVERGLPEASHDA